MTNQTSLVELAREFLDLPVKVRVEIAWALGLIGSAETDALDATIIRNAVRLDKIKPLGNRVAVQAALTPSSGGVVLDVIEYYDDGTMVPEHKRYEFQQRKHAERIVRLAGFDPSSP
jgi:hypothetical protein